MWRFISRPAERKVILSTVRDRKKDWEGIAAKTACCQEDTRGWGALRGRLLGAGPEDGWACSESLRQSHAGTLLILAKAAQMVFLSCALGWECSLNQQFVFLLGYRRFLFYLSHKELPSDSSIAPLLPHPGFPKHLWSRK